MWPSVEPTGPINEQLTKLISDLTTDAGNVRGLSGELLLKSAYVSGLASGGVLKAAIAADEERELSIPSAHALI